MENKKGKFIVIYGTNNLGKTSQAKLLVKRLNSYGYKSEYIKYPIYDLEPAGKLIDHYYRFGNPYNFSARESQLLHYIDRISFEPILKNKLNKGIHIIAEDYFGTALAWGLATGVELNLLKYLYSFLYPEDLSILFDGTRFREAIEKTHHHETDDELINKTRLAHLQVGQEYSWYKINANQPWQNIQQILWEKTINIIEKPAHYFIAPNFKELHDQIYSQALNNESQPDPSTIKNNNVPPNILIQRLSPLSRLPQKILVDNSGYYLFAADYYSIPPKFRATIKTGLKIAIPDGFIGIITNNDAPDNSRYVLMSILEPKNRDEIIINMINLSGDIINISPGQKIAKLFIQKTATPDLMEGQIK